MRLDPLPLGRPDDGAARRVGFAVGAIVAGIVAVVAPTTGFGGFTITSGPPFAVGILAAGSIGGWIAGPGASHARGWSAWLRVVVGLGLLAVLIGDVAVVGAGLVATALAATNDPLTLVWAGPIYVMLGLVAIGPFALPFTMGSAAIWAAIMWGLRQIPAALEASA